MPQRFESLNKKVLYNFKNNLHDPHLDYKCREKGRKIFRPFKSLKLLLAVYKDLIDILFKELYFTIKISWLPSPILSDE